DGKALPPIFSKQRLLLFEVKAHRHALAEREDALTRVSVKRGSPARKESVPGFNAFASVELRTCDNLPYIESYYMARFLLCESADKTNDTVSAPKNADQLRFDSDYRMPDDVQGRTIGAKKRGQCDILIAPPCAGRHRERFAEWLMPLRSRSRLRGLAA